ncbi:NAD(+) synthase [Flavobacterium sp.]|uniref:NAD(+) synthase n=1 Tax=Flavobacterium sp. TaxID=239 RepID=UPI003528580F
MAVSKTFNAEEINKHIVNWLLEYATNAKVRGFVVGISGGIDSALTSTLCAQTGLPTLCVEMPIHQAQSHVDRANEHINNLKNKFSNVIQQRADLTPVFESFKSQIPTSDNIALLDLTLANTRARLRMTTLYYFAGIHQFLVAGTGNKVEDFGVGFFTKYGDGGVDISPIADLMKSEVRALAAYLNISESILKAKPTDGLFGDDRSDEDQLGASYDELEWAMLAYEKGSTITNFSGREAEVFAIFTKLNKANQHKMNPIPICIIPKKMK